MIKIKRYGWRPSLPDHRDFKYHASKPTIESLPLKVDLRSNCPPIDNQFDLGSCTANAVGGLCEFVDKKIGTDEVIKPSRLFIYYNTRKLEGTVGEDSGAYLRDVMKAINRYGYPSEDLWPYEVSKFTRKPPKVIYEAAKPSRIETYSRVEQHVEHMKACLAEGFPFAFGFTVYESFEHDSVAKTGIMIMPVHSEVAIGGHAVLAVGYDDERQKFIVRNSWGEEWGDRGYFHMPYSYITNPDLSADLWTLRFVP